MKENDKRCAFAHKGFSGKYNHCDILAVGECDGFDTDCKFRKTKVQLTAENDRSIDRCRMLNRCHDCIYHPKKPCKKSDEVEAEDWVGIGLYE